ncbi:MAG: trimeric intracellular cation channel family protein [Gemmatimonadota bacterium]
MWTSRYITASTLVLVLDLCGTFVFALSGAMAGLKHKFDLFGVLVLSFVAANLGGIMRDVIIGAVPPPGIADWRYVAVSVLAGLATIHRRAVIDRMQSSVQLFDAGGLALFAVSGAQKALDFHLGPLAAVLLGMLTGIGGGMARDVLAGEVPSVLRGDIYAVAALAGAAVVVVGRLMQLPSTPVVAAGAAICFGLRFIAIRRGWQLPGAHLREDSLAHPRTAVDSSDDGDKDR